ncbi:endonuclease/exonuclease/phosphatase family protein [Paradesertivirga mongoliensis]|uniref:Endonuclease/exonuclease/phosphatase family protein n=1 Tax=Paradesertivirga mongoliensis TaxID=2100740 RepID=A0ABW4ZNJ0_9SPHI|nr:endonuclease/exonuclease/phosphatase family protein [Pedobacter mongoliensis]
MAELKVVVEALSCLFILMSLIPLVRNDYWAFRVFEYPRFQKLLICITLFFCILFFIVISPETSLYIVAGLLFANICYLFYQVYPFTGLSNKELKRAGENFPEQCIALMTGNVFQYNKQSQAYLTNIYRADPDVVLLLETDSWWERETAELEKCYPYHVKVPQENTYGMLLYSKYELLDFEVKFLVENEIPSIHTKAVLPCGQKIQLYCVHPTPPVPQENPRSTERDKELLLIADKAKDNELPVIVMGDLNDVAWSYTTSLFCKVSGLLDPRKGRGFFNTFHAQHIFLRFPLDHVFCSTDFKLVDITKLDAAGSDHFPMYVKLQYEKVASHEQKEPEADEDEKKLAEEKKLKKTA